MILLQRANSKFHHLKASCSYEAIIWHWMGRSEDFTFCCFDLRIEINLKFQHNLEFSEYQDSDNRNKTLNVSFGDTFGFLDFSLKFDGMRQTCLHRERLSLNSEKNNNKIVLLGKFFIRILMEKTESIILESELSLQVKHFLLTKYWKKRSL